MEAPQRGELLPGRQPWALNEAESQPFFRQALDLGINFFDTANVYSGGDSEAVLGRFLKANARREAVGHRNQGAGRDAGGAERRRTFAQGDSF